MDELIDITKEAFLKNGMDIADVYGMRDVLTEQILSSSMAYMHGAIVQYLNDTGHELAAQALDDAWHAREDQWWRQHPERYDQRYLHGEELLDYREAKWSPIPPEGGYTVEDF